MFTGLVAQIGTIRSARAHGGGMTIEVACTFEGLVLGESIATNGTCLTVTAFEPGSFTAEASAETLAKTTLGALRAGARVHLERALQAGARLGGHLVTGHVDGVGRIVGRTPLGDAVRMEVETPEVLAPFLAPKGSITVDGVSLTINGAHGARFDVALVPFTRRETTFDERPIGAPVNLEVDVLAKYVARLLGRPGVDGVPGDVSGVTLEKLREHGFL